MGRTTEGCANQYRIRPGLCATFYAEVTTPDNLTATMVGPTEMSWQLNDQSKQVLSIGFGRVLISPGKASTNVDLLIADHPIQIGFREASHVVAVDVMHLRQPGIDPLDPESHTPVRSIIAVQGTVEISGAGTQTIDVGQAWSMHGSEEPVVTRFGSDAKVDPTAPIRPT